MPVRSELWSIAYCCSGVTIRQFVLEVIGQMCMGPLQEFDLEWWVK